MALCTIHNFLRLYDTTEDIEGESNGIEDLNDMIGAFRFSSGEDGDAIEDEADEDLHAACAFCDCIAEVMWTDYQHILCDLESTSTQLGHSAADNEDIFSSGDEEMDDMSSSDIG